MLMSREERDRWIHSGRPDPVRAFRAQATYAGQRGIGFHLTFEQWWALWEPHYANRGCSAHQLAMCRTGDAGAYELGNVRIDTVKSNAEERGTVRRARNVAAGRLPTAQGRTPLMTQSPDDWLVRRRFACKPYTEEEGDDE